MTANQSAQLVQKPDTKKALAVLEKFAKTELEYKAAEKKAKEATAQIRQAMIDNNVVKLEGEWGYITLAERTNYKAEDIQEVEAKFLKSVLDTDKVKAEVTLKGSLPDGVVESKTQYITKKFKEA